MTVDGAGTRTGVGATDAFGRLRAVADAVLYEGYLLYPYRRSSPKNRVRWQFGVLSPRDWAERDGPVPPGLSGSVDSWYQQTQCLLRAAPTTVLRVQVRYLQLQYKQIERREPDGRYRPVESLAAGDAVHLTFDEAVPREVDIVVPLERLLDHEYRVPAGAPAGEDTEPLPGGIGRVVRRRHPSEAVTALRAERVRDGAPALYRLTVRTENTGASPGAGVPRAEALRHALLATHTLVGADDGTEFLSLTDPPPPYQDLARTCRNLHTFPVLGGEPGGGREHPAPGVSGVLLSAPILLPDHPQVAPESPGDLHDAAEIDEILSLRTLLLTDEEKREARATDPRAADILDRVEGMPPEMFAKLHGAIRSLRPAAPTACSTPAAAPAPVTPVTAPAPVSAPAPTPGPLPGVPWWHDGGDDGLSPTTDTVLVDGVPVAAGSAVRLRPAGRGADAQDMFLAGRTATVAAVLHDVDGSLHVAVTLDDDPAAELHGWYGRFHYFRPHELTPLTPAAPPAVPPAGSAAASAPRTPTTPLTTTDEAGRDGRP
ncbi:hypothetical protein [Streptomyces sp. bgisy154]|uniref:hypothetical protein n=1 Tax=Streptomyces sp. bgisy154 TaxID=3413794 RepID=UPI003D73F0A8